MCAIFHEGTGAGDASDGGENGERRPRGDAARAGDDHHGDRRFEIARDHIGDHRTAESEVDQPCGQTIGEALHRWVRRLRLTHRVDDAAVGRVGAHAFGAHLDRPDLVDRPGEDLAAGGEVDRPRFAGDTRLVRARPTRQDHPVDRDATARRHDDGVALLHVGERSSDRPIVGAHLHGVGQEAHEVGQGVAAAIHREVLEDFGSQHERSDHERRHPFADRGGGDDRDEHGQLHAHAPVSHVFPGLGGDRPASHRETHDRDDRYLRPRPGRAERDRHGTRGDEEGADQIAAVDAAPQAPFPCARGDVCRCARVDAHGAVSASPSASGRPDAPM